MLVLADINYDIDVGELEKHGFTEYYSHTRGNGEMKHGLQPPDGAKEIFMGGGLINSSILKMGIFASPDELFDQKDYADDTEVRAKRVRQYYAYYASMECEPIGFSKHAIVNLDPIDAVF